MEYKELLAEKQELDIILKGMNEKILIADKINSNLIHQITTLHNEIGSGSNELDWLKTNTNSKVENYKNEFSKELFPKIKTFYIKKERSEWTKRVL